MFTRWEKKKKMSRTLTLQNVRTVLSWPSSSRIEPTAQLRRTFWKRCGLAPLAQANGTIPRTSADDKKKLSSPTGMLSEGGAGRGIAPKLYS